ncbi:hypothetical protein LPJ81_004584, partial [Coemansia sp. IMI 209127]
MCPSYRPSAETRSASTSTRLLSTTKPSKQRLTTATERRRLTNRSEITNGRLRARQFVQLRMHRRILSTSCRHRLSAAASTSCPRTINKGHRQS